VECPKGMIKVRTPFGNFCYFLQKDGFLIGNNEREFYKVSMERVSLEEFLKRFNIPVEVEDGIENVVIVKIQTIKDGKIDDVDYVYFDDNLQPIDCEVKRGKVQIRHRKETLFDEVLRYFLKAQREILNGQRLECEINLI